MHCRKKRLKRSRSLRSLAAQRRRGRLLRTHSSRRCRWSASSAADRPVSRNAWSQPSGKGYGGHDPPQLSGPAGRRVAYQRFTGRRAGTCGLALILHCNKFTLPQASLQQPAFNDFAERYHRPQCGVCECHSGSAGASADQPTTASLARLTQHAEHQSPSVYSQFSAAK